MRPVERGLRVCILPHVLGGRTRQALEHGFKVLVDAEVGQNVMQTPIEPGASAYCEWARLIDYCDVAVIFCSTAKPITWALVGHAILRHKPMLFLSEQDNFPFEVRQVIDAARHSGVTCDQGLPRSALEAFRLLEQFAGSRKGTTQAA